MISPIRLSPCPDCESLPDLYQTHLSHNPETTYYTIKCPDCGLSTMCFEDMDNAVYFWNCVAERKEAE